MEDDCWSIKALRDVNSLAGSIALEKFNGTIKGMARLSLVKNYKKEIS
jgi:hypothetical protein